MAALPVKCNAVTWLPFAVSRPVLSVPRQYPVSLFSLLPGFRQSSVSLPRQSPPVPRPAPVSLVCIGGAEAKSG